MAFSPGGTESDKIFMLALVLKLTAMTDRRLEQLAWHCFIRNECYAGNICFIHAKRIGSRLPQTLRVSHRARMTLRS